MCDWYYYNQGQVRIWPYPRGNKQHTVNVLERIRQENPEREITIIWDGASYHRAFDVCEVARKLKIELVLLPPYSPGFMPVEARWRWLREDLIPIAFSNYRNEHGKLNIRLRRNDE